MRIVATSRRQSQAPVPFACRTFTGSLPGPRFHGLGLGFVGWTGRLSPAIVVHSTWTRCQFSLIEPAVSVDAKDGTLSASGTRSLLRNSSPEVWRDTGTWRLRKTGPAGRAW